MKIIFEGWYLFEKRSTINNKYKFWDRYSIFPLDFSTGSWSRLPVAGPPLWAWWRRPGVRRKQLAAPPLQSGLSREQGLLAWAAVRPHPYLLQSAAEPRALVEHRIQSNFLKNKTIFIFLEWPKNTLTFKNKIHNSIVVLDVWTNHLCVQTTANVFYILTCEESFKNKFFKAQKHLIFIN